MPYHLQLTLIWIHLLGMVGAFGALLIADRQATSESDSAVLRAGRMSNLLLGVGLVAGLVLYLSMMHTPRYHMTVGIKVLLLLFVGAAAGMAPGLVRKGKRKAATVLRRMALTALALAALLGTFLRIL